MGAEYSINETHSAKTDVMFKSKELVSFWLYFKTLPWFKGENMVNLYEDTDEETVIRILALYNESLKEGLASLRIALSEQNCDVVGKVSHKLAGTADLLGFSEFAAASRNLNQQIKANPAFMSHISDVTAYLEKAVQLNSAIQKAYPTLSSFL